MIHTIAMLAGRVTGLFFGAPKVVEACIFPGAASIPADQGGERAKIRLSAHSLNGQESQIRPFLVN